MNWVAIDGFCPSEKFAVSCQKPKIRFHEKVQVLVCSLLTSGFQLVLVAHSQRQTLPYPRCPGCVHDGLHNPCRMDTSMVGRPRQSRQGCACFAFKCGHKTISCTFVMERIQDLQQVSITRR